LTTGVYLKFMRPVCAPLGQAPRRSPDAATCLADNALLIAMTVATHKFLPHFHGSGCSDRQREVYHHLQLPDAGYSEHGPR
jgi:hypothetical protein